jgi:hypothetical protein
MAYGDVRGEYIPTMPVESPLEAAMGVLGASASAVGAAAGPAGYVASMLIGAKVLTGGLGLAGRQTRHLKQLKHLKHLKVLKDLPYGAAARAGWSVTKTVGRTLRKHPVGSAIAAGATLAAWGAASTGIQAAQDYRRFDQDIPEDRMQFIRLANAQAMRGAALRNRSQGH